MKFLHSCIVAFSMYSSIPMPKIDWSKDTMSWAICFFPAVGIVIGALLMLWLNLCGSFAVNPILRGVIAFAIPIAVSGGIHLDGFCDTADALASNQPRERKLEILQDSHTGAFAIITCGVYLILYFAAWCTVPSTADTLPVLCLIPVLSRALSGLAAVTLPNARRSGLLAAFTEHVHIVLSRAIFLCWIAAIAALMILAAPLYAAVILAAAACVSVYYTLMSHVKFGGITGDLEGFFLQINELAMLMATALLHSFFPF